MKKTAIFLIICALICFLCGCSGNGKTVSATYFYFDTVVTVTADCSESVLNGAFDICEKYENMLSRTKEGSDVSALKNTSGSVTLNQQTVFLLNKAMLYSKKTEGLFDVTVASVTSLYDFSNKKLPEKAEIDSALEKVGYENIKIEGNTVIGGIQVDLGGIAKGFIADEIAAYLKENGVSEAVINLGGNIITMGEKNGSVGIKNPFEDSVLLNVQIKNKSFVTSGIDQRCFTKDGVFYHHIINPFTGYPVDNTLSSVTVIGESSADADALSTCCMLLGKEKGIKLIEEEQGYEAVFIEKDGTVTVTSGLKKQGDTVSYNY